VVGITDVGVAVIFVVRKLVVEVVVGFIGMVVGSPEKWVLFSVVVYLMV
jgi:hypothetical protein